MTDALTAIFGGALLAAFIVVPCGAAVTSGGSRKEPLTLAAWWREASTTLWAINPVIVWRDLLMGYDDVVDSVVRMMAGLVVIPALLASGTMMGWGFYRLFCL